MRSIRDSIATGGAGKVSNQLEHQFTMNVTIVSNAEISSLPNALAKGKTKAGAKDTSAKSGDQWARHESSRSRRRRRRCERSGHFAFKSATDGCIPRCRSVW
jgi:hypothetical protein